MDFRELSRTLKSKLGAEEDRQGHHISYGLILEGQEKMVGKVSHSARGSDQVPDFIVGDTAKRLRLTKPEFLRLVDCIIDKDEHQRLWRERAPGQAG